MIKADPQSRAKGFTIMELLVATLVFSAVLLLITTGIMQIARVYYKGVTETNTQNTARSIMDTVAQAIQFSGGSVDSTSQSQDGVATGFCVGNQHFTYVLGRQVKDNPTGTNQIWHALVQKTISGSNCTAGSTLDTLTNESLAAGARDLVGPQMRLADFSVTRVGSSDLYQVHVKIIYGDDDLLSSPPTDKGASCLGIRAGSQFCSVAELNTVVVKRVRVVE